MMVIKVKFKNITPKKNMQVKIEQIPICFKWSQTIRLDRALQPLYKLGEEVLRDNRIIKLVTARTVHFYSVCESPRQRPEVLGRFGLGRGQWASGL